MGNGNVWFLDVFIGGYDSMNLSNFIELYTEQSEFYYT